MIPKSFLQDLIVRTDIVSVIASRIELKKRGGTHIACCPFHHEKTPSFTVSHSKQFYYCFGCGAHGNAIGFLMEYDHLPFVDAVTHLAQSLGITIPIENTASSDKTQFEILYHVLSRAQQYYSEALKKSPEAIDYFKKRGIDGKTAKQFGLGFSPNTWDFLSTHTTDKKTQEALATAGMLIPKKSGKYYDRFRHRVMFPIRDARGRVIGFGGRTLTTEIPKYINSPETPIFHKQQTLYGLYEMCQQHQKLQRIVVAEGYLDVIALAQHDIHYAVATLGTALNIKHIQILLRYTSELIFCFDGDAAGRKAAWKALTICLPLLRDGVNFRFLFLDAAEDPDSLIRKIGKLAFEALIDTANALPAVFFAELEKTFPNHSIADTAAFAKQAKEYLSTMPEGIYKNLLLNQLAAHLQLSRDQLQIQPTLPAKTKTIKRFHKARLNLAESAIQLLLHYPKLAAQYVMPTLTMPNASLEQTTLILLIKKFLENTQLHFSELLLELEDEAARALVAAIAARTLHIPAEGAAAEFSGALQRLQEKDQDCQLTHLNNKQKQGVLDDEERQLRQLLLNKKNAMQITEQDR